MKSSEIIVDLSFSNGMHHDQSKARSKREILSFFKVIYVENIVSLNNFFFKSNKKTPWSRDLLL